jgi:hypothetical protein
VSSFCANPWCDTPDRLLRDGRGCFFPFADPSGSAPPHLETHWLCRVCLETMNLIQEGQTVRTRVRVQDWREAADLDAVACLLYAR